MTMSFLGESNSEVFSNMFFFYFFFKVDEGRRSNYHSKLTIIEPLRWIADDV